MPKIYHKVITFIPTLYLKGLGMVLDAATTDNSTILEPYLENLLNVLFPQVCILIPCAISSGNFSWEIT